MALFDYTVRIQSRFACPTPASAAPMQKAAHQLPQVFDARTPHAEIDVRLSASGTTVDRTNVNWYAGHCPDSAVMVGAGPRAAYAAGLDHTAALSRHRLLAVVGAAAVGAAVGVLMAVASVGLIALAAYLGLTATVASWQLFAALLLVNVSFDTSLFASLEWRGWAALHRQLGELVALCDAAERRPHLGVNAALREADQRRIEAALASDDWALQQAALELVPPEAAEQQKAA